MALWQRLLEKVRENVQDGVNDLGMLKLAKSVFLLLFLGLCM